MTMGRLWKFPPWLSPLTQRAEVKAMKPEKKYKTSGPVKDYLIALGSKGGQARSEAKTAACRENARKPRKRNSHKGE